MWKNYYWVIGKQHQLRNTYKDFSAHFEHGSFWIVQDCLIFRWIWSNFIKLWPDFDTCPNWTPVYEWKIHIKKSKWHSKEKDHFSWSLLMLCSGEYYVELSQLNTCWTCGLQQKMFLPCITSVKILPFLKFLRKIWQTKTREQ